MKRELKFKGWNGKRITREYTLNEMLSTQIEFNGLKENWLQYTGLKDKNGVEIYEGDIIRFNNDNKLKQVVKYGELFNAEYSESCIGFPFDYYHKDPNETEIFIEVIGNIYENPHTN